MSIFKVGDEVGSIKGEGKIISINPEDTYAITIQTKGDVNWRFMPDGHYDMQDKHPSIWLKSTGHPPFTGEEVFEYPLYRRGIHHTYEKGLEVKFSGVNAGVVTYAPKSSRWRVGDREVGWVEHEDKTYWEPCEKPKWRPTKPTWCWVWNDDFPKVTLLRLVTGMQAQEYLTIDRDVQYLKEGWNNADPCDPEDIPDYWPEDWT